MSIHTWPAKPETLRLSYSPLSYGSNNQAFILLPHGADPNQGVEHPETNGYLHASTPLMLATQFPELIQALLKAGADPNAMDDNEFTALDLAQMNLQGLEFSELEEDVQEVARLELTITLLEKAMD